MRRRKSRYRRDVNYLFVDGYNIINSWQSLIELKNVSLEDARNELIDTMIEFSHTTKEHIILVFDAYLVKKSGGKTYKRDGIDVIFTKEFETADHYIERQLDEIGKLTNVRVATSDNVEQQIILSRGGTRISARELEAEVNNSKNKVNYVAKKLKEERVTTLDEDIIHKLKKLKHDMTKKNS
ncbi:NYN domain-containing protein [Peptoniphilus harei]|uniref:Predicted RNA-binding protein containing a PIN domain n=1 Tax=Peptoniphilus harei TaxID=54005 RepID=A0A2X1XZ71_9FIRM|nr:NYN domain-containing protein [Peptoniphilus harei]QQT91588.1 NYN domain-containing protein [Peptoniphilus harei]SPY46552.1 Predicted RNA-binding protein containing a PIN domain [Peptoniphilus harei]